jgi:ribonuclease HII
MGYGTADHIKAIQKYGSSSYHRKSFGICKTK